MESDMEVTCVHCDYKWFSKVDNPKRCPRCYKQIKYATKYVKSLNDKSVWVSGKCYSLLIRKQNYAGEPIKHVINRLLLENVFSDTVEYPKEKLIRKIYITTDSKMELSNISNAKNLQTYNEVIWRLAVNASKKTKK